ncbi:MAG: right-handed parallel beta-helix repeat-containing protein [Candidatus Tenebribacter burtonii]|nr:right-handed parallel beta-helix repeat-containing protein [Candidatus Tenebribacter burtonii]
MKRKIEILLICCVFFLFFGCNSDPTSPPSTHKLSGKIIFMDSSGQIIENNSSAQIDLYAVGTEFEKIKELKSDHSSLGTNMDSGLFSDHRLLGEPVKSAITGSNGEFEIKDIAENKYILVYSADGFGWHKRIIDIHDDEYVELNMRETIIAEQPVSNSLTWGPDQHIIIDDNFAILTDGSLIILENTVIEISSSDFSVIGELEINGSAELPVILTSSETQPAKGDWEGVTSSLGNCDLTYCIIQWAGTGIDNEGNLEVENTALLNSLVYGVIFDNNSGIINNCTIYDCRDGIYGTWTKEDSEEIIINNSIFMNNDYHGLQLYESSPAITNCYYYGNSTHVKAQYNSYPLFEHCTFENSELYAIYSEKEYNYDGQITINYCEFIDDNTFAFIRCYRSADIVAEYNNFLINEGYIFHLEYYNGGNNVLAQNNWWGTTVETEIQDLILDETDEPGGDDAGTVNYSNWFSQVVGNAGVQP